MIRLIGTTLYGGLVFLFPVVITVLLVGKAIDLVRMLVEPLARVLPVQSMLGLRAPYILAVVLLLLICLLAGYVARMAVAGRFMRGFESTYLQRIPAYAYLKTRADSLVEAEAIQDMRPCLVRFDDHWQVAFEIERLADERVVIYLPGAPDPWSGSVHVFTTERVTPLPLSVRSAGELMLRLGRGTAATLEETQRVRP